MTGVEGHRSSWEVATTDLVAVCLARRLNRAVRQALVVDGQPADWETQTLRRVEALAQTYARRVGSDPVHVLCDAWVAAGNTVEALDRAGPAAAGRLWCCH